MGAPINYKGQLVLYAYKYDLSPPTYVTQQIEGTLPHDARFHSTVKIGDDSYGAPSPDYSRRKFAETAAAKVALDALQMISDKSPYNLLRNRAHEHDLESPTYTVRVNGDSPHLVYTSSVKIGDKKYIGEAAASHTESRMKAAVRALNEYGFLQKTLREFAAKNNLRLSEYKSTASGPDDDLNYTASVKIANFTFVGDAAKSKEEAEKNAAKQVLINMEIKSKEEVEKIAGKQALLEVGVKSKQALSEMEVKSNEEAEKNSAKQALIRLALSEPPPSASQLHVDSSTTSSFSLNLPSVPETSSRKRRHPSSC